MRELGTESVARAHPDPGEVAWPALDCGVGDYVESQYFESRLRAGDDQLDYLIALSPSRAQRIQQQAAPILAVRALADRRWQGIQTLLTRWADPSTCLGKRCPAIWLEYDDILTSSETCCPSISVCITRNYRIETVHPEQELEDRALCGAVLDALEVPIHAQQLAALDNVFQRLPQAGRFIHFSYMLGRTRPALKLYGVMDRGDLLNYLEAIGWAGEKDAIQGALTWMYPESLLGRELYFDLNLDDFAAPGRATLGLAVAQQHLLRGPDPDPSRARLLDAWVRAGLATPEKARRVRDWPRSARGMRRSAFEREERFLDLKLVWSRVYGFTAKSYLGRLRLRGLGV